MLCWGAKWAGEKRTEWKNYEDPEMVPRIRELMDESDAIVHYNGNKFDIPVLNGEIATAGLPPPSPSRQIDLCATVKKKFRFPSNKLEYVAVQFGVTPKVSHEGHKLWVGVLADDAKAWRKMKQYNIGDVQTTEELYWKLLPWIDGHPNLNLYDDTACPRCGSEELTRQGYAYTALGKFQRWNCKECGAWSRSSRRVSGVDIQAAL